MKVLAAMSGGVDSSVAAALLLKEGYEVIGITLRLRDDDGGAAAGAGAVARKLGIEHHVIDFREVFERQIVADFCREYACGRTPNPCVRCNRYVKFAALLEKALELGAGAVATGHYARIEKDGGRYLLKKGADARKDQSYFLCQLTREQLSCSMFPVGHLTKEKVREIAAGMGLPAADRPESQEICFIPGNNHAAFIESHIPQAATPGPIVDEQGNNLGVHRGITAYTVGQRQGLGISAALPLYVTAIEPERNAVVVGSRERIYGQGMVATGINWMAIAPPQHPLKAKVKIRYRHREATATLTPVENGELYVDFNEPQPAITPGQTAAFYDGDIVIGGGTIDRQRS